MLIAVVQDKDSPNLTKNLNKRGIGATKLASTGGFLHSGNTTFLIGVEDDKVDEALEVIRLSCLSREEVVTPLAPMGNQPESFVPYPVTVKIGGANVFVINVDQHHQF